MFYIECCDGPLLIDRGSGERLVVFEDWAEAKAYAKQIFHDGPCGRFPCAVAVPLKEATGAAYLYDTGRYAPMTLEEVEESL